jgi:hypothetical protein
MNFRDFRRFKKIGITQPTYQIGKFSFCSKTRKKTFFAFFATFCFLVEQKNTDALFCFEFLIFDLFFYLIFQKEENEKF